MVRFIEKTKYRRNIERADRKRLDNLKEVAEDLLKDERIEFNNGFPVVNSVVNYYIIFDAKKEKFQAYVKTCRREILLMNKDFYPTAMKLAEEYDKIEKTRQESVRENTFFPLNLFIPKTKEWRVIEDYIN